MLTSRKDNSPKNTIEIINKILNDNNIITKVALDIDNQVLFSSRIEFFDSTVGTNGKGISKELALASAYAEFMERLQSGFLKPFVKYTSAYGYNLPCLNFDQFCESLTILFNSFGYDFARKLYDNEIKCRYVENYFDYFNKTMVQIPDYLISLVCGSNGICAGNTQFEAISQGICEVFERYALYIIYKEPELFPTIPESFYRNSYAYNIIKYLQKKGIKCIVKDCSMGGVFPVLGVILIDATGKKSKMNLGADINFDIALQRCLSETFQGHKLSLSFSLKMNQIINIKNIGNDWKRLNDDSAFYNYSNQCISGTGLIPLGFYLDNGTPFKNNYPFIDDEIDNERAFNALIKIIKSQKCELLIYDYSILGFPTYRVFIPNMSSLYFNIEIFTNNTLERQSFKRYLHGKNIEINEIIIFMKKQNKIAYMNARYTFDDLAVFPEYNDLFNDSRILEICALSCIHRYQEAYECINKYFPMENKYSMVKLYLKARSFGFDVSPIFQLSKLLTNDIKEIEWFIELENKLLFFSRQPYEKRVNYYRSDEENQYIKMSSSFKPGINTYLETFYKQVEE